MTEHDRLHEVRDWALGILPDEQADAFLAHLETCDLCQRELERTDDGLAALVDASESAPPEALRARVMAAVREEAALSRAADESLDHTVGPEARERRRRTRPLLIAAALAAVVTVAAITTTSDRQTRPPRPVTRTIAGTVTGAGGGPGARARITTRGRISQLRLTDIAAPPDGRVYQVWILHPGHRSEPTGSLFSVPRSGDTTVALPSLRSAEKVIVTAEPPRGSSSPTLPAVAVVSLSR